MSQEVKVGQVWIRDVYGYQVVVVEVEDKDLGFVSLVFRESNGANHLSKERKDYFLTRYHQKDTDDKSESVSLRDHFAGLAMNGMIDYLREVVIGEDDLVLSNIASLSYSVADGMLKARGK